MFTDAATQFVDYVNAMCVSWNRRARTNLYHVISILRASVSCESVFTIGRGSLKWASYSNTNIDVSIVITDRQLIRFSFHFHFLHLPSPLCATIAALDFRSPDFDSIILKLIEWHSFVNNTKKMNWILTKTIALEHFELKKILSLYFIRNFVSTIDFFSNEHFFCHFCRVENFSTICKFQWV